jgi:hypothetical protein
VSKQDRKLNPDLERCMAKRMYAITIEVDAGAFVDDLAIPGNRQLGPTGCGLI